MLLGPRRDDSEAAACARAVTRPRRAPSMTDGIDLVLAAVAIDRGARRPGDHRTAAALERAPHQPVDQRVLERASAPALPADGGAISQSG